MEEVRIVVFGEAQPAGSKRAFPIKGSGKVQIVDANPKSREWKDRIAAAAGEQYQGPLLDGPLFADFTFYRPRPKSHYGSGRNGAHLKDSSPLHPITRPDVLKLARAAEDALQGVVYRDDSQIVDEHLRKLYGEPARVEIVVRSVVPATVGDERQASLLA